jgi:transposase
MKYIMGKKELGRVVFLADTNFAHFQELLKEREGIAVSYSTVSTILKTAGIVSKRIPA